MVDSVFLAARAAVLADLQARRRGDAEAVSALEDALEQRRWWAEQWPEGVVYVAGLVAQDVQDALFESVGRWPVCLSCARTPPSTRSTSSPTWAVRTRSGSARRAAPRSAELGRLSSPGRAAPAA